MLFAGIAFDVAFAAEEVDEVELEVEEVMGRYHRHQAFLST